MSESSKHPPIKQAVVDLFDREKTNFDPITKIGAGDVITNTTFFLIDEASKMVRGNSKENALHTLNIAKDMQGLMYSFGKIGALAGYAGPGPADYAGLQSGERTLNATIELMEKMAELRRRGNFISEAEQIEQRVSYITALRDAFNINIGRVQGNSWGIDGR